jgi:glycosyltransferase involved in cell wall biosynthesis
MCTPDTDRTVHRVASRDRRPRRLLSNLPDLARHLPPDAHATVDVVSTQGTAVVLSLLARSFAYDAIVLYYPGKEVIPLCLLKYITRSSKPLLMAVDKVFGPPRKGLIGRIRRWFSRLIWSRVDVYILHIREVSSLRDNYGIEGSKCEYVPFKINHLERLQQIRCVDGDYIFTGGKSRRDFDTFCAAMNDLPYRAIILTPQRSESAYHGTAFDAATAPSNVEVIHDDGTSASWNRYIAESKFVVFCISPDTISASGVGAYLVAMALRKCVIITECPATRGILTSGREAVIVPPRDPHALANAIRRVSEDEEFRQTVAECGYQYAIGLGDRADLVRRIGWVALERLRTV